MTYTSAQANKLLKKLNDEHAALLDNIALLVGAMLFN